MGRRRKVSSTQLSAAQVEGAEPCGDGQVGGPLGGFRSAALSALLNWEPRAGPVLLMSLISINLMIEDVLNRITAYKIYPPATSFHFGRFAFFGAKTFYCSSSIVRKNKSSYSSASCNIICRDIGRESASVSLSLDRSDERVPLPKVSSLRGRRAFLGDSGPSRGAWGDCAQMCLVQRMLTVSDP